MKATAGHWWFLGPWLGVLLFCCGDDMAQTITTSSTGATKGSTGASTSNGSSTSTAGGSGGEGFQAGGGGSSTGPGKGSGGGGGSVASSGAGGDEGMCLPGSGSCMDVSTCDYGICKKALGWAFDGKDCVAWSGCSCAPNCAGFHPSLAACIQDCSKVCDTDAFLGYGLAKKGWMTGSFCDQVTVCVDTASKAKVASIFPNAACDGTGIKCPSGQVACQLAYAGAVTTQQYEGYCDLTLIQAVSAVYCSIYR